MEDAEDYYLVKREDNFSNGFHHAVHIDEVLEVVRMGKEVL